MKDSIKNRKKSFLALCLSVMMLSSVAAFASCTDGNDSSDSSSSSSSVEEVKDVGLIKNAGFETFDSQNVLNTSVTGWTRSTTSIVGSNALSSKAASGIVDLDTDAWENLTGSNVNVSELTEKTAEEKWDSMTVKDKLAYYDLWKEQNSGSKIAEKLSFYESMNIDSGDIPTVAAFDTHDGAVAANAAAAEDAKKKDTKVLMIHNEYPEASSNSTYKALGTGQQYTSSSTVTVKAGTSAKFSVWVKTADLKSSATDGSVQEAIEKGAFISITHSVGGKTLDAYKVENINTKNVTDNNGWQQYSFILKGSSFTDTTFTMVLGLGQGSTTNRGEYVNGYAFFDDIECETIDNAEYDDALTDMIAENQITANDVVEFRHQGEEKVVNVYKTPRQHFALDFYGDFEALKADPADDTSKYLLDDLTIAPTETDGYTSVSGKNPAPWLSGGKNDDNDVTAVLNNAADIQDSVTVTDAEKKAELAKLYDKYFADDLTFASEKTLLLMSLDGAAYTAKSNLDISFGAYNSDYLAISFFVKTSNMAGYTGAGVTLVDGSNKTSFSSIDTSEMEPVMVGEDKLYGDWQQYFFFVENKSTNSSTSFSLEFNFGPTAIDTESKANGYYAGFAAFTNFQIRGMKSKAEFESAKSGTYAKIVSVGEEDEVEQGSSFDTPQGTPSDALENGLARPQNYLGVAFDGAYVQGVGSSSVHANENAGLISKEHFVATDGYFDTPANTDGYAWLDGVKGYANAQGKTTATDVWDYVFGNSSQPILIYNAQDERANAAYGYIGTSKTFAANTYTAVSVRVRGTGKAYVRLVDVNANNYDDFKAYNKPLSIGAYLTYWYNDDGNICTADPEKKSTQVAFKLQPNGLYKANARWDGYGELENKDAWYANLSAYNQKDEKGNLLVAEGGAKHDYNDYWNNAGMNGIAFYYDSENDRYCADAELKVPVVDLKTVTALKPRTEAATAENYKLEAEVDAVENGWKTVTFYVHTGDLAKNYRLEIWSGDKNGKGNDVGYLVIDANNPGSADSNFTSLLEEYEDKATAKFESVFSYFDTPNYLRYNKELDENKVGNLYDGNYTPSEQKEGVAYLLYEEDDYTTIFADYQYSEKTVAAESVTEDEEEEDDASDDGTETNVWLLASSLAIAGVLILAIVSIVVRKAVAKARKNRAANGGKKTKKK